MRTNIFPRKTYKGSNRYMKRCSASRIIRKIQIKTTMRHHLTPARMAIVKKRKNTNCLKDVDKRKPFCTIGGNVNQCSHDGKQYGDSSKYLK